VSTTNGVRPALKLNPSGILFASEIKNSADTAKGETPADSNYAAGTGGKNFKLTVVNNSLQLTKLNGPEGGTLANGATLPVLSGGSVSLAGTVGGGAEKLVYKIVDRSCGRIVGYGAGSATDLTVSSAGLLPGGDYTLYVWPQKDTPLTPMRAAIRCILN
jgi:hypothetical protein